jgi:hypothetical protein
MLIVRRPPSDFEVRGGEEARMGRLYHDIGMGDRIGRILLDMLWCNQRTWPATGRYTDRMATAYEADFLCLQCTLRIFA